MRDELRLLGRHLSANPQTALLMVAYASAWYFPISWAWRLTHPGQAVPDGMDGPVSWNWRWWLQASSPLSFQLLVPIGVLLLLLRYRLRMGERWQRLRLRPATPKGRMFSSACLILGCFVLLLAHLVHVISLAVIGLEMIGVGAIAWVFGPVATRAMVVPLLFWLTMFMPPETVPAKVEERLQVFSARGGAALLRLQKRPTVAEGWTLQEGGARIQVSPSSSGGAVLGATLAFFLWHGLYTGRRPSRIFGRLVIVGAIALVLNLVRVVAIGRLNPGSTDLADRLNGLNPWWLVPVSLGVSFAVLAALERLRPPSVAPHFDSLSRRAARPIDRALDSSGRALGRASERLGVVKRPFDALAHGLEALLLAPFKALGRSSQQIENQIRRWERNQRRRKRDRR